MAVGNQVAKTILMLLFTSATVAMDLKTVYQLALENDPLWLSAVSEAEAGREIVAQTASQLLPQLSLDGSYSRVDLHREGEGDQEYRSRQLALMLTQPILNRPARVRYEKSLLSVKEIDARLRQKKGELLERVIKNYFAILQAKAIVEQLSELEESNRVQLYATTRAYELGQGTRTDVDEAQSRLDLVMVRLMQAKQQVDLSHKELSSLVGKDVGELPTIDREKLMVASPKRSVAEYLQEAEQSSSLLEQAELLLYMAKKSLAEQRSQHLPTLDLFVKKSVSDSDTVNTIGSKYDTGQIGVSYRIPLYSGGSVSSKVREAEALVNKQKMYLRQVMNALHLQVDKEYQNVIQGAAKITAMQQVVSSAQQLVYSTEKGIVAGTRTTLDWLNALQQLSDAERQLSVSHYEYLLSQVRLEQLAGKDRYEIIRYINQLLV